MSRVYECVGPDEKLIFSDRPARDVVPVEVQPAQSRKVAPVSDSAEAARDATGKSQQAIPGYAELTVISLRVEEGAGANGGNMIVKMSLESGSHALHRFQLKISGVDSEFVIISDQPLLQLSNLSRGYNIIRSNVWQDSAASWHLVRADTQVQNRVDGSVDCIECQGRLLKISRRTAA